MAVMVGFSSSLTIVARMNMSSPMPSVHLADSPLSLAVMTGEREHVLLLECANCLISLIKTAFIDFLIVYCFERGR